MAGNHRHLDLSHKKQESSAPTYYDQKLQLAVAKAEADHRAKMGKRAAQSGGFFASVKSSIGRLFESKKEITSEERAQYRETRAEVAAKNKISVSQRPR